MKTSLSIAFFCVAAALSGSAQVPASGDGGAFGAASATLKRQLEESLAELAKLREEMGAEQVPLAERIRELEAELVLRRQELQQKSRALDARSLDLNQLRDENKKHRDGADYVANLLGEYIRNFESRLHVAELQRYRKALESARLAAENTTLTPYEVLKTQAALLSVSLDRLDEALAGTRFPGSAVDAAGIVRKGTFVLLGPAALFRSDDGLHVGTAEQRVDASEPVIVAFASPADTAEAARLATEGRGAFPLDPTLGNAHKVAAIEETFLEHVKKGGPIMYPIIGLAGLALLVALWRRGVLTCVRRPSSRSVRALLHAVSHRDLEGARTAVRRMRGPGGRMLAAGVQHLQEPRELIEEVMYESVLETKLRLQSFLPFVGLTASAAPLLGLLGTVTGIMNTFTLMTVFGTGDVKTLSTGISEALITTEFGLYVAIPSLALYAFLSRKAKGIAESMEKLALALANEASRARIESAPEPVISSAAQGER